MSMAKSPARKNLNKVKFTGGFTINTPMGPASVSFDFPEGLDLATCFDLYEELANEKVEELRSEAQKQAANQIITPGGNKAGNLIIP